MNQWRRVFIALGRWGREALTEKLGLKAISLIVALGLAAYTRGPLDRTQRPIPLRVVLPPPPPRGPRAYPGRQARSPPAPHPRRVRPPPAPRPPPPRPNAPHPAQHRRARRRHDETHRPPDPERPPPRRARPTRRHRREHHLR